MSLLENFPLISQRTPVSADGSSPNANFDCVPTSLIAGMMYLHGVTNLSAEWNPDKLLDMAYPEGYKGGTSALAFVDACAKLGCTLTAINGIPGVLVQRIHEQLALDHPVIVTIPDPYLPSSYGYTHVLCAYADEPGYITMLDPWPGKPTKKSDGEWQSLLQFNQIWYLERIEDVPITIDLNNPVVARYFEFASSDGFSWRCRVNGKIIQGGMLQDYCNNGAKPLCGLSTKRLPLSNEIPIEQLPGVGAKYAHLAGKGIVVQFYEAGAFVWDVQHLVDNPPDEGPCYPLKLYDPTNPAGQGPLVTQLQTQLATAQASRDPTIVATLQAKIVAAQKALS